MLLNTYSSEYDPTIPIATEVGGLLYAESTGTAEAMPVMEMTTTTTTTTVTQAV